MTKDQLFLLDDFGVALLTSMEVGARSEIALDFFVPRMADGAQLWLNNEHGLPHRIAMRGPCGSNASDLALVVRKHDIGLLRLCGLREEYAHDEAFLQTIAHRFALALHNAGLFAKEQRVSLTFQNAAIITALPETPAVQFDALYQAGGAEALVGGDWYDAFALPDGRLIVSVGDVVGSGLNAAVAMVSVRQTLRGVAHVHADPVLMAQAADRTMRTQYPDRYVTAFVAVFDPITQQCAYVNAGHPPPFLRSPEGWVRQLHGSSLPLGVPDFNAHVSAQYVHLPEGSLVVLYTDGLTEASRDIIQGETYLRAVIEALDIGERALAQRIHDGVLGGQARDDVAILTMHVKSPPRTRRWRFDPRWADVARRVRLELAEEIGQTACARDTFDIELIYSELMANLVRYAPGTIELFLERRGEDGVLHVLDKGPGFQFTTRLPNDLFSESGRGLFLISQLADDFNVARRPGGGSHARIVLTHRKETCVV
ncbi:MAG: SpoIIE family protein phosphatase [Candidatus Baltobacteraceae bacterium]